MTNKDSSKITCREFTKPAAELAIGGLLTFGGAASGVSHAVALEQAQDAKVVGEKTISLAERTQDEFAYQSRLFNEGREQPEDYCLTHARDLAYATRDALEVNDYDTPISLVSAIESMDEFATHFLPVCEGDKVPKAADRGDALMRFVEVRDDLDTLTAQVEQQTDAAVSYHNTHAVVGFAGMYTLALVGLAVIAKGAYDTLKIGRSEE